MLVRNDDFLWDANSPVIHVPFSPGSESTVVSCKAAYDASTAPVFVNQVVIDNSDPNHPRLFITDRLRHYLIEAGWQPPAADDEVNDA